MHTSRYAQADSPHLRRRLVSADAIVRLRALAARLAAAPEYMQEQANVRCAEKRHRHAYQAGALEQVCRSTAEEIASIVRLMDTVTCDTITKDQIRELFDFGSSDVAEDCLIALHGPTQRQLNCGMTRKTARERCAAVWNARHGSSR